MFKRPLLALMGVLILSLTGCSGGESEPVSADLSVPTAVETSSPVSVTTTSSTTVSSSTEVLPAPTTSVFVEEPSVISAPLGVATTTIMDEPDDHFGIECFSGTPDQWPSNVDMQTGCRPYLDREAFLEELVSSIDVSISVEPEISECLFGTPGPTLMTDGTVQYTDYCYEQGISAPGYVNEGEMVERYWECINAGGEIDTCREWSHSF